MPNNVYIGSRYVPLFDGAWNNTKSYEALTIVEYGNNSYTSKKPVPAGTLPTNTSYWALTGNYNGQIANLQSAVSALTNYKNAMIAYVTPEMYGAIGDGVTDDTQAINDALTNGSICVCMNTYKTKSPIEIPEYKTLIVNGIIDYDGVDCAVKLTNRHTKIDGIGIIQSNGNSGLEITTARHEIKNITVSVTGNYTAAIIIESNAISSGIAYINMSNVKMFGRDSNNYYGSGLYIHTTNDGFINENTFDNVVPAYFINALKIYNQSSNPTDRNKFTYFDGEGCDIALYAYSDSSYIMDCVFDFRKEEFGNVARIYIDDHVIKCKFVALGFAPQNFSVINPGTKALFTAGLGLHNLIDGLVQTNSGATFGYNGAFHLNGDVVVFDVNSQRDSTRYLDGNETLSRATSALWPNKIIEISPSSATLNLDLNYVSDWCTSPLEYIIVNNSSGTTVSIINDNITLFSPTLLAKGYYKVIYNGTHDGIVLEKITLA